jgi:hypothetical protein
LVVVPAVLGSRTKLLLSPLSHKITKTTYFTVVLLAAVKASQVGIVEVIDTATGYENVW